MGNFVSKDTGNRKVRLIVECVSKDYMNKEKQLFYC